MALFSSDEFERFEGTADELADIAVVAARRFGLADDPVEPNVRLLRDYLRRGILSKPERRGKEAIFNYRHLIEFLGARVLVADGWPLAKVADYVASARTEDLESLLHRQEPQNAAVSVVQSLLREQELSARSSRAEVSGRQAQLSQLKRGLPEALKGAGNRRGELGVQSYTVFGLAPGVHLGVEQARLEALTLEEAEALGRAVTASLVSHVLRRKP